MCCKGLEGNLVTLGRIYSARIMFELKLIDFDWIRSTPGDLGAFSVQP